MFADNIFEWLHKKMGISHKKPKGRFFLVFYVVLYKSETNSNTPFTRFYFLATVLNMLYPPLLSSCIENIVQNNVTSLLHKERASFHDILNKNYIELNLFIRVPSTILCLFQLNLLKSTDTILFCYYLTPDELANFPCLLKVEPPTS